MIRELTDYWKRRKNPIGYWRGLGANIGENCSIHPSVAFGSEPYLITIGNQVRLCEDVRLLSHDGGLWVVRNLKENFKNADKFSKVVIGNNVHVGIGSTIMPGVTIGNNCIIGVGAIVTKDIPDNSVAVGVPAKVIESVDEYIEKNLEDLDFTKQMSPQEKKEYILKKFFSHTTIAEGE